MRFGTTASLLSTVILAGCHTTHSHDTAAVNVKTPTGTVVAHPMVNSHSGPLYGHAEDYTWLVGQLQRIHMPGGKWKLRYTPIDEEDRWGGSVVLAPDIRLTKFEDGENVYVEGEVLNPRASLYLAGPLYRIRTIQSPSGPMGRGG